MFHPSKRVTITQGGHAVSDRPEVNISTLLGSCVACCLWDATALVGGMNHILLGRRSGNQQACDLAGINAMELLVNDLLKLGAMRKRLKAKVFGGAQMVRGLSEIGSANTSCVLDFLENEGIECTAKSVGGDAARHIIFWPCTGSARQKIQLDAKLIETATPLLPTPTGNGLELF